MDPDLVACRQRAEQQIARVAAMAREPASHLLVRRPDPQRWSAAEHLQHTALATEGFVEELRSAIERARKRGWFRDGPYRRGPLGRFFVSAMTPPVKRRMKTSRHLVPNPPESVEDAAAAFDRAHGAYLATLEQAGGLDLGRVLIGLPASRLLRLRAIQGFEVVVVHADRHLWLAEEAREAVAAATVPGETPPPAGERAGASGATDAPGGR